MTRSLKSTKFPQETSGKHRCLRRGTKTLCRSEGPRVTFGVEKNERTFRDDIVGEDKAAVSLDEKDDFRKRGPTLHPPT